MYVKIYYSAVPGPIEDDLKLTEEVIRRWNEAGLSNDMAMQSQQGQQVAATNYVAPPRSKLSSVDVYGEGLTAKLDKILPLAFSDDELRPSPKGAKRWWPLDVHEVEYFASDEMHCLLALARRFRVIER